MLVPFAAMIVFLLALCSPAVAGESLFVEDTIALAKLEQRGFAFAEILQDRCSEDQSTLAMIQNPSYQNLIDRLGLDFSSQRHGLEETIPEQNLDRIDVFPKQWLKSASTRFELVGLTLRPDRIVESPDTCGEFRLIYRLRYNVEMASRLPMTLMLEYDLPKSEGESCEPLWTRYTEFFAALKADHDLPTNAIYPQLANIHRLKVNIQASHVPRFRSHNKIMQGQYILRSFKRLASGYFVPEALENSVDFAAINADETLKNDLLDWLRSPENLVKIDQGNYLIPEKFLSTKAMSVVPFGLQRIANQSMSRIFKEADFAQVDFSRYQQIKSADSFLRRLDSLSCQGCHVSRSVAGFHFMGAYDTMGFNTIFTPYSNHFAEVQNWRESFLADQGRLISKSKTKDQKSSSLLAFQLQAKTPNTIVVPAPERSHASPGGSGQHCGVKGAAGYEGWSCAKGFACYPSFPAGETDKIGICLPEVLLGTTGQVCDAAKFVSKGGDPALDELTDSYILSCGEKGVCAQSQHGFPNGKCTHSCKNAADHLDAICVPTPKLTHFSPCLASGKSFKTCIDETSAPVMVVTCDRQKQCQDDFVCAGVAGQNQGVCLPSYTQPQLLLHPHPTL